MDWVSVKDRPLITPDPNEPEYWIATKDGEDDFIAAVPYQSRAEPGKTFWWIHHCILMDVSGLCVVTEDDFEPAGWDIKDVKYWAPWPASPE